MALLSRDLKPVTAGSSTSVASGLDALETPVVQRAPLGRRAWAALWPKLLAFGIFLAFWQAVVWSGWRPEYVLPGPGEVLQNLWHELFTSKLWRAIGTTMSRGAWGFALSIVLGTLLGLLVSRFKMLRSAFGSLITGLQTMPSIAWFPLALLLFKLSDGAIYFVMVLGAGPSIANGIIHGVDHIPPLWTRAGKVLGARGVAAYRHVIVPAAMPSYMAGLKQGWAFSWRSLMAGELIVTIANKPSIGQLLQVSRDFADSVGTMTMILVILIIGIVLDAVFFASIERKVRRKRGLLAG